MGRMIALVVDTILQIIEAWYSNIKVSFSASWVAASWTLVVDSDDHLSTCWGGQEHAVSTTKEVVTGGRSPIDLDSHVVNALHCSMMGCACSPSPELLTTSCIWAIHSLAATTPATIPIPCG